MEETVKTPAEEKVAYRLSRPYWDGRMTHEAGSIVYFIEGKAPSTAVALKAPEVPADDDLDE